MLIFNISERERGWSRVNAAYVEGRVIPPYREHIRYEGVLSRGGFINSHREFARGFCTRRLIRPGDYSWRQRAVGLLLKVLLFPSVAFPSNGRQLMGN